MKLLLDLGNSCCKSAMFAGEEITMHETLPYDKENRLAVIESILHKKNVPDQVIICSVLDGNSNQRLIKLFSSYAIHDYYFLDPSTESFGIQLGYSEPGQLGADRLATLIAAHEKFDGNKCIVDCGTAVTVDALDANGIHQGGVIFPSVASMQRALSADTGISHNKADRNFDVFASNTQDAIYTGCLAAVVGGIQQAVNIMQAHYGLFDLIIMTGGNAKLVIPMLTQKVLHESKLVLNGLMIVSRYL